LFIVCINIINNHFNFGWFVGAGRVLWRVLLYGIFIGWNLWFIGCRDIIQLYDFNVTIASFTEPTPRAHGIKIIL
jgi:hypothetical protein